MASVPRPSYSDVALRTERLELRCFRHADAADLFTIFSDPQVSRYLVVGGWKHVDEAHQRIARDINATAAGEYLRVAIERTEDHRVIGECSIFSLVEGSRRAEIGYALARSAWGCGYAVEALRALIGHVFGPMGLNRLEADIDPRNGASARTLERLGFAKEGHLRERWIVAGEVSDTAIYGLLRSDWPAPGNSMP